MKAQLLHLFFIWVTPILLLPFQTSKIEKCDLDFTFEITAESCQGLQDGNVLLQIKNGCPPFEIKIDDETKINNLSVYSTYLLDMSSGYYTLIVSDAKGCSKVERVKIPLVSSFQVKPTSKNTSGLDSNDGRIDLNLLDEVYNIVWNDGSNARKRKGLSLGEYSVTVSDILGCIDSALVVIEESFADPDTLSQEICTAYPIEIETKELKSLKIELKPLEVENGFHLNCLRDTNGSVDAIVTGGVPPYQFVWYQNGECIGTTKSLRGVSKGAYEMMVTDAVNSSATSTIELKAPSRIQIINKRRAKGGTPPYKFERSGREVIVTDANGCLCKKKFAKRKRRKRGLGIKKSSGGSHDNIGCPYSLLPIP